MAGKLYNTVKSQGNVLAVEDEEQNIGLNVVLLNVHFSGLHAFSREKTMYYSMKIKLLNY